MSFLNAAMLWGLGAVSIPIIIHLLNRRRFVTVRWAAMEFLLQAQKENRKRIRFEHLLVLLLRCLALALLALMIARPQTSSAGLAMLPGVSDPVERVVILDDSGSMGHRSSNTSSFERAKQALEGLFADLRKTRQDDYVSVLRTSRPAPLLPPVKPTSDGAERFLQSLDTLRPSQRTFDVPAVLERALERDEEAAERRMVIYVLTDMRSRDWVGPTGGLPARIGDVARQAPEGTRIVVVDVGLEATRNLGVVAFLPTEKLAQSGVPLELEVRVRNYGDAPATDVPLTLESGDGRLPLTPIPLIPPGEEKVVRHRYTFPAPGPASIRIRLPDDALEMDDARQLALEVEDQLRVLLIDGQDSSRPLESETDMLRLALAPPGDQNWGVEPVVQLPHELGEQDLASYPTVVACNLDRWPPAKLDELKRFVRRGGGLAIFLGDRVDVEDYEKALYEGGAGLLPCRLGQRIVYETEEDQPRVRPPGEDHPLTRILKGDNNPFLRRVRARVHMTLPLDPQRDGKSKVLLRLGDSASTPFVVEKPYGRGQVVLFNTTADREWSNWPREASFPIIAMQLVRLLSPRSTAGRNLGCGEELVRPINPAQLQPVARLALPGDAPPRELHAERVEGSDALAFRYADTVEAGVYTLALRTQTGTARAESYAVNVDPTEGDLARVDPVRLEGGLGEAPIDFVRPEDTDGLLALTDGEQSELWRTCLYALLAVLLLEQVLAYRAAHHRPAAPASGDAAEVGALAIDPPWKVRP